MSVTHVVGVDPGLVHTGVVSMLFDSAARRVVVQSTAVPGLNTAAVWNAIDNGSVPDVRPQVFVEAYRPRSNFDSDKRMVEGVAAIRDVLRKEHMDVTVLNNTGVKAVVKKALMDLLGVWSFSTTTHHQDLRSAARIGLLGMMKDDTMNQLLADIVRDHLAGSDWHVVH
jgi:hypothetical protein